MKLKKLLPLIIFIGLSLYWLIGGILLYPTSYSEFDEDTRIGDYVVVDTTKIVGQFLEVKNKLNFLIPVGSDKYYLVAYASGASGIVVKATGEAEAGKIYGRVDAMEQIVYDRLSEVCKETWGEDSETYLSQYISPYCLDTTSKERSIWMILEGLLTLVVVLLSVLIVAGKINIKEGIGKWCGWSLLLCIAVIIAVAVLKFSILFPSIGHYYG